MNSGIIRCGVRYAIRLLGFRRKEVMIEACLALEG